MELFEKEVKPQVEDLSQKSLEDITYVASDNFNELRSNSRKRKFSDKEEDEKKAYVCNMRTAAINLAASCVAIVNKIDNGEM